MPPAVRASRKTRNCSLEIKTSILMCAKVASVHPQLSVRISISRSRLRDPYQHRKNRDLGVAIVALKMSIVLDLQRHP